MKVTVINKDKRKDYSFIYSIILLVLGIFLTFNSEGLINILFDIIGALVILFGLYHFLTYFRLKKQLQVENSEELITGIVTLAIGLIVILLSNFLTNAIQIVTGLWLFFTGLSKLSNAMYLKSIDKKNFLIHLVSSIILIILGVYTLFANNVVFIFIGIILIVYSVADLINHLIINK